MDGFAHLHVAPSDCRWGWFACFGERTVLVERTPAWAAVALSEGCQLGLERDSCSECRECKEASQAAAASHVLSPVPMVVGDYWEYSAWRVAVRMPSRCRDGRLANDVSTGRTHRAWAATLAQFSLKRPGDERTIFCHVLLHAAAAAGHVDKFPQHYLFGWGQTPAGSNTVACSV